MNNFERQPYDENRKNYEKSVSEFSKFFLDHSSDGLWIGKSEFGSEGEEDRVKRLQVRLEELVEKATKRLGYKVDEAKLINDAYRHILNMKSSGELPDNNILDNFCAEIEERLDQAA